MLNLFETIKSRLDIDTYKKVIVLCEIFIINNKENDNTHYRSFWVMNRH